MKEYRLVTPCHFGLEGVLKREIYDLGYEIDSVEDGRVTFSGDEEAVVRANIGLRTAERVLLYIGEFDAYSFEEFFQGIEALPWEKYIPKDGRFWVTKATSVKSKLFSTSDLQSLAKKAMVKRLSGKYHLDWFPEDGAEFPVRLFLMKDHVTVTLDTTGVPLHKRGYRTYKSKAPLSETMAAGIIMLSPWKGERILMDPFCGSGTIPIEAALMAANIAPGLSRSFTAEKWKDLVDPALWKEVRSEARSEIDLSVKTQIQGFDIDPDMVDIARKNAEQAGVAEMIHFQRRDVKDTSHSGKYGFIITNPPYGERLLSEEDMPGLYKTLGKAYNALDEWSMFVITSFEDAEKYLGRKSDKNRKLYNGMIKTRLFQYMGGKPPKKKERE